MRFYIIRFHNSIEIHKFGGTRHCMCTQCTVYHSMAIHSLDRNSVPGTHTHIEIILLELFLSLPTRLGLIPDLFTVTVIQQQCITVQCTVTVCTLYSYTVHNVCTTHTSILEQCSRLFSLSLFKNPHI